MLQRKIFGASVALVCAALLLGALGGAPTRAQTPAPSAATAPTPATGAVGDYRLGIGDKVRVIVFGETNLSGEFVVSDSGVVSFPLIGAVPAAGLNVSAFQEGLRSKLAEGYLRDPRVSAEVLLYRPFYILGEVSKPGEYPYTNGLTVMNAVATAGGFTYRANTRSILVRRAASAKEETLSLTAETQVAPGDTIRVKERFF